MWSCVSLWGYISVRLRLSVGLRLCVGLHLSVRLRLNGGLCLCVGLCLCGIASDWGATFLWGYVSEGLRMTGGLCLCVELLLFVGLRLWGYVSVGLRLTAGLRPWGYMSGLPICDWILTAEVCIMLIQCTSICVSLCVVHVCCIWNTLHCVMCSVPTALV